MMIALQLFQKNKGQHDAVEQIKDIGNGNRDGMISVNSHYQVIQHKGDGQQNSGFVYAYKNSVTFIMLDKHSLEKFPIGEGTANTYVSLATYYP